MQFRFLLWSASVCVALDLVSAGGVCSKDHTASQDLCDGGRADAVVQFPDEDTYIFRGEHIYRLDNENGIKYGYPARIADKFPGLPSCVDAGFRFGPDVYIFKGDQVWKIAYNNIVTGYPQLISREFPGIPNDIDAAYVCLKNSRLYVFKKDSYWRYGPKVSTNNPGVNEGYPLNIKKYWIGMPDYIDGAVKHANGYSYFFKGDNYYRYNDKLDRIDTFSNNEPYIMKLDRNWYGCP